jgi:hypothetical protein
MLKQLILLLYDLLQMGVAHLKINDGAFESLYDLQLLFIV